MITFEKILIASVSVCAAGLALAAVIGPPQTATKSPRAEFTLPLEARVSGAGGIGHLPRTGEAMTVETVASTFKKLDYSIERVRTGTGNVPPLFIVSFPHDIEGVSQAETRKNLFFKMVLPLVLSVNDKIYEDRQRLLKLAAARRAGKRLAADERLWLAAMAEYYDVERRNLKELVLRMDTVPPSLAIAQAAEESGWGTSRFAREGNALFGQWTFASAKGIIPKRRDQGKVHRVKAFPSLMGAARAYVRNLNTHRAYRRFRAERAAIRRENAQMSGVRLAQKLDSYSERGSAYVRTILNIINTNRLHELDGARLGVQVRRFVKKPTI